VRLSEAYTNCLKPDAGKAAYGSSCSDSSQCLTEYCFNSTCSCPDNSFLDSKSGLCAQKSGDIQAKNGDCGYIISTNIPFISLVQWNINGEYGTYVTLVILEVNMDPSWCSYSYLEVYEGSLSLRSSICALNDSTAKYQASKSNSLTVKYRGTTEGYKGFRAVYYIRNYAAVLTEPTGYISSPGYPVSYDIYSQYSWLITAKPGQIITLSSDGFIYNDDYVKVYNGQNEYSSQLRNFTSQWSNQSVTSTSNSVFVKFTTSYVWTYTGFSASYQVYVLYGNFCGLSDKCAQGMTCIGGICTCSDQSYYDQTRKTCQNRVPYGSVCNYQDICAKSLSCSGLYCSCNSVRYYDQLSMTCINRLNYGYPCSSNDWCVAGLSCEGGSCGCASSQYYDAMSASCYSRFPHGYLCSLPEQCAQGFICVDYVCRCSSSQYYDSANLRCRSGILYGQNCSDQVSCVQDLSCYSGVCDCPQNKFYDTSSQTCQYKRTYGMICYSSDQCAQDLVCDGNLCRCSKDHYYDYSSQTCKISVDYGDSCNSTDQCSPGLVCWLDICQCSQSSYYNTSSRSCYTQLSHTDSCETSEQCLSPLLCVPDISSISRCLCPSETYFYYYNCINESLLATMAIDELAKSNSVHLTWTLNYSLPNVSFIVTCREVSQNFQRQFRNSEISEIYIDGLLPGTQYNVIITILLPSDNYYQSRSVDESLILNTRQIYGRVCDDQVQCDERMKCDRGVCVCANDYYFSAWTKLCEKRLTKGYECNITDECKVNMTCALGHCGCLTGYYYQNIEQQCYPAFKRGQQCDPSIQDMCVSRDLVCRRDTLYSYTCQQSFDGQITVVPNVKSEADTNTTLIALIVVSVFGWAVAIATGVCVIVLCRRIRNTSTANGCDNQLKKNTGTKKNDYRTFPPKADQDPLEYVNKDDLDATSSVHSYSNLQITTSAQPALSARPTANSKPLIPVKPPKASRGPFGGKILSTPTSTFTNTTFEPEPVEEEEDVYEELRVPEMLYHNEGTVKKGDTNSNIYQNCGISSIDQN
ncbi:prion-(Q/N-rich) domain-bearing protein 25, partial [Biomphalaria glabrata]